MDTAIGYLQEVREDLLGAAVRGGRAHRPRGPAIRERFSLRSLVAAGSVVVIVAAGTVGWLVTRGDLGGSVEERAASGATGGAAGGGAFAPTVTSPSDEFRLNFSGADLSLLDEQAALVHGVSSAVASELSRVIRTAEIGLVIPPDSFDERFADAVDIASANDGFVATSTTRERSGGVTMRVPAANFNDALRSLRELGDVEVQTVQGKDVTAEFVDLFARLRISKARRQVLLRLMDRANSIEQTIRVRNALDETQLQIEELQGQLRFLSNRTSLATIRVSMHEEGVEPLAEVETPSIPNAFERSVAGFVGVIAGVVIGLGYVIPIVAIALAVWFVIARIRRRRIA